jgi:hypothetical protein
VDGTPDVEEVKRFLWLASLSPVANVGGPYSGFGMTPITFSGSGTDPDGDSLSFIWTIRDAAGQTYGLTGINSASFFPGNHTVTLVVSDGNANSAPSTTAARGQTVQLSPFVQDRDGQVVAYAWRQVSGQAVPLGNTASPQLTFTIPKSFKAGDLVFEVKVTDNLGGQATDQVKVSVTR